MKERVKEEEEEEYSEEGGREVLIWINEGDERCGWFLLVEKYGVGG